MFLMNEFNNPLDKERKGGINNNLTIGGSRTFCKYKRVQKHM